VLHHDGRWTHQGVPVLNRKLRAAFDRGVRYLPEPGSYVVEVGRFRGAIQVEEAAFFVREFDAASGRVHLSDGSHDDLDPASLRPSTRDGALLCTVKRALVGGGLPARFTHSAQAELLLAVVEDEEGMRLEMGGGSFPIPRL
jgi:hypothetical protein